MSSQLLRLQRDTLVLESFSMQGIQTLLKDSFADFVTEFKDFSSRFSSKEPAIPATNVQVEFMRELMKRQFMSLAELRVYVPEGLEADFLTYVKVLAEAAEHATGVIDNVLAPYSVYLSQLISHPEQKFSTAEHDKMYQDMQKMRDALNMEIGACFKQGSHVTDSIYGRVIRRNADWLPMFQELNALINTVNKVERKTVTKKTEECVELLNIVTAKIARGELEGVSEQSVKNLANGCYQVALELENFVAVYYRVQAFASAVQRSMDGLKEALKETA